VLLQRTIYPVIERQEAPIPLAQVYGPAGLNIYDEVLSKGYFSLTLKGSKIILSAGNHVGLIPLNDKTALYVEPKIAKANWLYIVGRARGELKEISYLREYTKGGLAEKPLLDFLSRVFVLQLTEVDQHGLHRLYQPKEEITSFPKGRILFEKTIRKVWSQGRTHSVVIRAFDFSKDTPHNRLLRYALELAIQYIKTFSLEFTGASSRLADLENLLSLVPLDSSLSYLPEIVRSIEEHAIPESRSYYEPVCSTAILLVENSGLLPHAQGAQSTFSFVVNMETIFEDFCLTVLSDNAAALGWSHVGKGKHDDHFLFCRQTFDFRKAEPDIIIRTKAGAILILEVKYKDTPNRNDINQAVTYAVSYNTSKAVLLCFCNNERQAGWQYLGSIGGDIAVWVYRVFLDSLDLRREETRFAMDMNDMILDRI
jgi:5-methylcytosine-specific restriction enzyme subunit McrC